MKCNNTGDFSLTRDLVSDDMIPRYAILSHTCGTSRSLDAMICNTFGSTRAASINQAAPSFRRLSTPCLAGTAMCILRMSRDPSLTPTGRWQLGKSSLLRPFGRAGGSPDGLFKSLFSKEGEHLGNQRSLERQLHEIMTGLPASSTD